MFKNLTGFAQMLRSASSLGPKIQEMKEKLARETAMGSAGADMVRAELSGLGEVKRIRISPDLLARNDVELLEELIPAAMNEALAKVRKMHVDMMREVTGGIDLPGLEEALSSI